MTLIFKIYTREGCNSNSVMFCCCLLSCRKKKQKKWGYKTVFIHFQPNKGISILNLRWLLSQPYSCNLLRDLDFSGDHSAPQSGSVNWTSSPLEHWAGLNFRPTGKHYWDWALHGDLDLASQTCVPLSWEAGGVLAGGLPTTGQRGKGAERELVCSLRSRKLGLSHPPMVGCFPIILHRVSFLRMS